MTTAGRGDNGQRNAPEGGGGEAPAREASAEPPAAEMSAITRAAARTFMVFRMSVRTILQGAVCPACGLTEVLSTYPVAP